MDKRVLSNLYFLCCSIVRHEAPVVDKGVLVQGRTVVDDVILCSFMRCHLVTELLVRWEMTPR